MSSWQKNQTLTYTIEWNKETGEERELDITFNYYPGEHYAITRMTESPPDPPEVEVLSAMMNRPRFTYDINMEDVWDELCDADQQFIIEYIYEVAGERDRDRYEE